EQDAAARVDEGDEIDRVFENRRVPLVAAHGRGFAALSGADIEHHPGQPRGAAVVVGGYVNDAYYPKDSAVGRPHPVVEHQVADVLNRSGAGFDHPLAILGVNDADPETRFVEPS